MSEQVRARRTEVSPLAATVSRPVLCPMAHTKNHLPDVTADVEIPIPGRENKKMKKTSCCCRGVRFTSAPKEPPRDRVSGASSVVQLFPLLSSSSFDFGHACSRVGRGKRNDDRQIKQPASRVYCSRHVEA